MAEIIVMVDEVEPVKNMIGERFMADLIVMARA